MSNVREIRGKINSIKNTKQITKAMQMVAASKMRKAEARMRASRPFAREIRKVISHVKMAPLEEQHPYLLSRKENNIGIIVISSDRGLCGGLNANLFRKVLQNLVKWDKPCELVTVGRKAKSFFAGKCPISASIERLQENLGAIDLVGGVKVLLDKYEAKKVDKVYLAYNEFINTMTQKPRLDLLLPITDTKHMPYRCDYIYEPSAGVLLDMLLKRYIESLVYQAVVENVASEQAARMVAMQSASDNAQQLIAKLQIMYNKVRQAAITREISEIVAGAAAV